MITGLFCQARAANKRNTGISFKALLTQHSYHRANTLPHRANRLPHMALSALRAAFCMHVETSTEPYGSQSSHDRIGSDCCQEHQAQACTNQQKTVVRQHHTIIQNSLLRSHFRNTSRVRRIYLLQKITSAVSRASVPGWQRKTTKGPSTCCIENTATMMLTTDRFGVKNPNMGWMATFGLPAPMQILS